MMQRVAALWPQAALSPDAIAAYWEEIQSFPPEVVEAAVKSYSREGREFIPTPGMLYRRVTEMNMDAPEWAEVLPMLHRLMRTGGMAGAYASYDGYREAYDKALEGLPVLVVQFVEQLGRAQVHDNLCDGQHGEPRLRDKWRAFTKRRLEDALLVGIDAPNVARIERANREAEPRGIGDAVKQIAASVEPEEKAS